MERVSHRLRMNLELGEFQLPLILAYADDLVVLADNTGQLDMVLHELLLELANIGLSVNNDKCSILIRDPCGLGPHPEHITLQNIPFAVVPVLKYLGIYLTSNLFFIHTIFGAKSTVMG